VRISLFRDNQEKKHFLIDSTIALTIISLNSNCLYEETFSAEDLMYLKVAIALFQSNLTMKQDMPKTFAAMQL
jgi:hypothetical protein